MPSVQWYTLHYTIQARQHYPVKGMTWLSLASKHYTCQHAGWTQAALFCPPLVPVMDCFYSLMNYVWASQKEERVRLLPQTVDGKPKISEGNCTLNWGILIFNVLTLVLSVLLILFRKPGSVRSMTAWHRWSCVCFCSASYEDKLTLMRASLKEIRGANIIIE